MFEAIQQYSLVSTLVKGGWVMVPLLVSSVFALGIAVDKVIWGPRRNRAIPAGLIEEVLELLHAHKLEQAITVARASKSPMSRLIMAAFNNSHRNRQEIIDSVETAGKKEASDFNRYLPGLALIASVCPLLGLLGTVFGIMKTFNVIGQIGLGNAQHLAAGIGEALIATATGLVIAIPTVVLHRYFLSSSRSILIDMEALSMKIIDVLTSKVKHEQTRVSDHTRTEIIEANRI